MVYFNQILTPQALQKIDIHLLVDDPVNQWWSIVCDYVYNRKYKSKVIIFFNAIELETYTMHSIMIQVMTPIDFFFCCKWNLNLIDDNKC